MLVGHFGAGFLAKRAAPRISLGTLVLAAMLADFLWCVFMLAGIEHVGFKPGLGAANYLDVFDVPYSHSLLANVLWGCVFAGTFWLKRRDRAAAWVLFAAVVSHWVLDVVSHRPDMQLAPGMPARFGLGLWTSIPATVIVEGGLWIVAAAVYSRCTRTRNLAGSLVLWIGVALLLVPWRQNIAGPPPPDVRTAGISSLIFFLLVVAWAYWLNRLRPARPDLLASPNGATWQTSQ